MYDVVAEAGLVARAAERRISREERMAWGMWCLFAFSVAAIVVGIGFMVSALIGALWG